MTQRVLITAGAGGVGLAIAKAFRANDFAQCRQLIERADNATRHWLPHGLPEQAPH